MKSLRRMKLQQQDILSKHSFLMAAIILLPLFFHCQTSLITEAYNLESIISNDGSGATNKIASTFYEEKLYFIPQSQFGDNKSGRHIYYYDIKTKKTDSLLLENSKKTKSVINQRFFSIEVTKDKIIVLTDPLILIFSYSKNKVEFKESIKNSKFFNKIKRISDDECFLYVNYNFHPMDAPDKHVWAKLNLNSKSIEQIKKMDDSNSSFTHFMNDWMSIYHGLISYANTTEYKIRFYDLNFNVIDSIFTHELDSTNIKFSRLAVNSLNSKEAISDLMKTDEVLFKRIQKIFLLDSSTIMVMLKLPKTRNCQFDLWSKVNGKWKLITSQVFDNFYKEGNSYSKVNPNPEGFFGNTNGINYIDNGVFLIVYFPYFENIGTPSFNRKRDYDERINEIARKGNLHYGIRKYEVKIK